MLLVTGPTGNVGRELVGLLEQRYAGPWRIGSRRSPQSGGVVRAVRFDFFDTTTWAGALADIETLFLLFPLPGIRAARQAIVSSTSP